MDPNQDWRLDYTLAGLGVYPCWASLPSFCKNIVNSVYGESFTLIPDHPGLPEPSLLLGLFGQNVP